jgi:hypothetical protein
MAIFIAFSKTSKDIPRDNKVLDIMIGAALTILASGRMKNADRITLIN